MIPIPHMPAIVLALLLAAFFGGRSCGASAEREEWQQKAQAQELAQKKQESKTDAANLKEVIRYVDRVQTVERRVPVVRERLVRLCDNQPRWVVSNTGESTPAPSTDADAGRTDQLGAELIDNRLNIEQCKALIAVARPQNHGRDAP